MKHIIILLLAILPILQIHSQENLSLGEIDVPFSEEIELNVEEKGDRKIICFTLNEGADIEICLDQAEGDNCLTLFDQEEDYVTDNGNNNSTGNPLHTKTFQNLSAGSYQISIESIDVKYIKLTISVTEANFKKSAKDLGCISCPSSFSEDVDLTNKYHVFHGRNMYNGMAIFRFKTTVPLELSANLCATSVSNPKIIFGSDNTPYMYQIVSDSSSIRVHVDELEENVYYVSVGSNDQEGALVLNLDFVALKSDSTLIEESYGKNNYIIQRSFTKSDGSSYNDKVIYYDEMGRELECVQKAASPTGKHDLVVLKEYDEYGRLEKEWSSGYLPTNSGSFVPMEEAKEAILDSNRQDLAPFTLKHYEESPRNLLLEEYGPGKKWREGEHANRMRYGVNIKDDPNLGCFRYFVEGQANSLNVKSLGQYATGALTVKSTVDEDGRCRYEFVDEQEHVVLSRKILDEENADTYYIFDAWGNLQAILPPMASTEMCLSNHSWDEQESFMAQYAYFYTYDENFRKIGSKAPGCDWMYVIYDNADTPIFTQNGEQREKGEWSFVISDVWGRPCLAGVCKNTLQVGMSLSNTFAVYDGSSSSYGYSIHGVDLLSPVFHKITFYDKYNFMDNLTLGMSSLSYDNAQDADYNTMLIEGGKDKETGSVVAIGGKMDKVIKRVNYYDYRGRVVQTNSLNHLDGIDKQFLAYDFTNHCTKQRQIHSSLGKSYVIDVAHTYDHIGRLRKTTMSINSSKPVTISDLEYDELGRLTAEKRNGNEKLKTTYAYNIRQWIEVIGGKLFNESLYYDNSHNGSDPLYGGDISAIDWNIADTTRGYGFAYDKLQQLVSANYYEDGKKSDHYSTIYSYDLMGNMQTLVKYGLLDDKSYGKIDDLIYEYNGNQVVKITDKVSGPYYKDAMHFVDGSDAEIEYEYDKNGCMTKDLNKNISKIEYNLLNLPIKLSFEDGSVISYSYDADGVKLSADYKLSLMNVVNGTTNSVKSNNRVTFHRDYCNNFIYEDGALKMLLFEGGYVSFATGSAPEYHFYIKDHLGNNRVVADANGNIEQVNHYYPFGGLMAESAGNVQPYKYNGKELDRMHGLDSYDYGARWLSDGRFTAPDPHAIDYADVSPYAYCGNKPINAVDFNGKDEWEINSEGYVVNRIENPNVDAFYIVSKDANGNYMRTDKSVAFKYETISGIQNTTSKNGEPIQVFQVHGDENSKALFEFLADNTNVEWAHMKFTQQGKSDGLNTVSTSHNENSEAGFGYIKDHMTSYGYLRSFTHNHPSNMAAPSGLGTNNSEGDMLALHNIVYEATKNGSIYPSSYIYTSRPKKYTRYSLTSKSSDFDLFECSLEDIVVKPQKVGK